MKNLTLWEKFGEAQRSGALMMTKDIYQAIVFNPSGDNHLVWETVPFSDGFKGPAWGKDWDGRIQRFEDLDIDEKEAALDALVGSESKHYTDEIIALADCLAFDLSTGEFWNLADAYSTVYPAYTYLENTNEKTITLDQEQGDVAYEVVTGDEYNLDCADNNGNLEYGGRGEHAVLYKLKSLDGKPTDMLLIQYWSQWQGAELDSGELLSKADALEKLCDHDDIRSIQDWLE